MRGAQLGSVSQSDLKKAKVPAAMLRDDPAV
jgi:hypothetical protein